MPVAYFRAVWASEFGGSELVLYGFQGAVGSYFRMRLTELAKRFSFIKEIRGEGLMIGVELTFPCKTAGSRRN
jgi:4-aminobutyrate aminotransferase-like enzyme